MASDYSRSSCTTPLSAQQQQQPSPRVLPPPPPPPPLLPSPVLPPPPPPGEGRPGRPAARLGLARLSSAWLGSARRPVLPRRPPLPPPLPSSPECSAEIYIAPPRRRPEGDGAAPRRNRAAPLAGQPSRCR